METKDEYREKNMNIEIVFSDVDGTLLNNEHKMLEGTMYAIRKLQEKDIPIQGLFSERYAWALVSLRQTCR